MAGRVIDRHDERPPECVLERGVLALLSARSQMEYDDLARLYARRTGRWAHGLTLIEQAVRCMLLAERAAAEKEMA